MADQHHLGPLRHNGPFADLVLWTTHVPSTVPAQPPVPWRRGRPVGCENRSSREACGGWQRCGAPEFRTWKLLGQPRLQVRKLRMAFRSRADKPFVVAAHLNRAERPLVGKCSARVCLPLHLIPEVHDDVRHLTPDVFDDCLEGKRVSIGISEDGDADLRWHATIQWHQSDLPDHIADKAGQSVNWAPFPSHVQNFWSTPICRACPSGVIGCLNNIDHPAKHGADP